MAGSSALVSTIRRNGGKERMITISSIKTMISVRPTGDETYRAELTEFILNGMKSETAQVHQLAHITLLHRRGEERAK